MLEETVQHNPCYNNDAVYLRFYPRELFSLHALMFLYLQERIIPPDPITPQEKAQTLQRLNEVIQYRLVSNELPKQMRRLKIGSSSGLYLLILFLY